MPHEPSSDTQRRENEGPDDAEIGKLKRIRAALLILFAVWSLPLLALGFGFAILSVPMTGIPRMLSIVWLGPGGIVMIVLGVILEYTKPKDKRGWFKRI
jgi:hypothetical protein